MYGDNTFFGRCRWDCDNEPSYTWGIDSRDVTDDVPAGSAIGSTIDEAGLYTAGDSAGRISVIVKD